MMLDDFKNDIYRLINESTLPIDAVYYVMKDILNDVANAYNRQLEMERAAAASQVESDEIKAEESGAAAIEKKEEK